jgi:VanZ family protein
MDEAWAREITVRRIPARMVTPLVRLGCAAYWVYLTMLLLAPNPARLAPNPATTPVVRLVVSTVPDRGVHFTCMAVLALLVHASRFALPERAILGLLLSYGVLAETLQWFVPPRCVELLDYLENLVGLLAGTAAWRLATGMAARWTTGSASRPPERAVPWGTAAR